MTAVAPRDEDEEGYDLGGTPDIQQAWQILAGGSKKVARVLINIAENGISESARVQAATTVLKMVGFGGPDVIAIQRIPSQYDEAITVGSGTTSSRQMIEDRMAQLRKPQYNPDGDADSVIDAEIVEPDD